MRYLKDLDKYSKREKLKIKNQSKLIKTSNENNNLINGKVLSVIGKTVVVAISEDEIIECVVSGIIDTPYKNSTVVAVGDNVGIFKDNASTTGRIVKIYDRIRKFSRKAAGKKYSEHVIAANLDQILIFQSALEPQYNKKIIDRLLVASEIGLVKPAICINKIDLIRKKQQLKNDFKIYQNLDIPIFFTSIVKDNGLNELKLFLTDKTTLFFGPSGVGKSSLVNKLNGKEIQKVQEISERTQKGQHTTSFVRMIKLGINTFLIDSPGIREFALWDIDRLNLSFHFHDFDPYYPNCKYKPCTHIHEPDCAVIEAVESGKIDIERYESYLNIYETIEEDIYI
jgi:ribosome biogenesis GTPase